LALFESCRPRGTWIDQLDPRTKLAWMGLMTILALTVSDIKILVFLPLTVLASGLAAGLPFRSFKHPLLILIFTGVQIVILQVLFSTEGQVVAALGPVKVFSGAFSPAWEAFLRLSAMMLATMQFLRWTPPEDLTLWLVTTRVPYRYAMLVGLAMRFLPLMEQELGAIMESQRSRGLPMKNIRQKIKSLIPVALPFLYRSFRRANETALAMELRGFGYNSRRTFLRQLNITLAEIIAIVLMGTVATWNIWLKIESLWL